MSDTLVWLIKLIAALAVLVFVLYLGRPILEPIIRYWRQDWRHHP